MSYKGTDIIMVCQRVDSVSARHLKLYWMGVFRPYLLPVVQIMVFHLLEDKK